MKTGERGTGDSRLQPYQLAQDLFGDCIAGYEYNDTRNGHGIDTPESHLWAEILADALRTIGSPRTWNCDSHSREVSDRRREDRDWLMDRNGFSADAVLSADNICSALGINLEVLRARVKRGLLPKVRRRLSVRPFVQNISPKVKRSHARGNACSTSA